MRALKAIGLDDCASLVRIAWLDLRRRNDRISIRELQALCNRVTDGPAGLQLDKKAPRRAAKKAPRGKKASAAKPPARKTAAAKRQSKSAHIIDMQAWRSRIPGSSQ
ncbi:MAG TPA: hypothetical protein VG889_15385 [Rhizomicrobium sp.]|nr:hypothetical protein [Rhizomicrobium sp.]